MISLDYARKFLHCTGGTFVCKVFAGELMPPFESAVERHFKRMSKFKPPASRSASSELYLVARNLH